MRKYVLILIAIMAMVFLSGCNLQIGDGLLVLTKLPVEYVELQKEYDKILATGATFESAVSGAHRQAVQLLDMDLDDENEVISFFKLDGGGFSVYIHKKVGEKYVELGRAKGQGKNIKSVEHITVTDDGEKAIAVSWELEEATATALTVYSLRAGAMENLLDVQYMSYIVSDMDYDACDEIMVVSPAPAPPQGATGTKTRVKPMNIATVYKFLNDETMATTMPLSVESDKVLNMTWGQTASGDRGIFIDSATEDGEFVTDIMVYKNDSLSNEAVDSESGSASATRRSIGVFSTDIDGDGIMEVPHAKLFLGYTDPLDPSARWNIHWAKIQKGKALKGVINTFYSRAEGWYFLIPSKWENKVSVSISNKQNVSETIFFVPDKISETEYSMIPKESNSLMSIYVIKSEDAQEVALELGATIIKATPAVTYAYKIHSGAGVEITQEEIENSFRFIKTDWKPEETLF